MWPLRQMLLLLAVLSAQQTYGAATNTRTMTYWASASDPIIHGKPSCYNPPCTNWSDPKAWEARLANLAAHRANFTGLIPVLHAIVNGGKLGYNPDGSYHNFLPYLPKLKAMGLEITAFLGNAGSPAQSALEATIARGPAFFDDAIQTAVTNGYDGYSVDFELRCTLDAGCWARMQPLAKKYKAWLSDFADALHKHNLILSVFVDGCCGYVNPYDTSHRGCIMPESTYDYQGIQCSDLTNSSVDRVISHATYGGGWHDNPVHPGNATPTPGGNVWTLDKMSAVGAQVIGVPKFSVGVKGGFSPPLKPANETVGLDCNSTNRHRPEGCFGGFDDAGRRAIDAMHKNGVVHVAKFMDEPTTEAEWAAWGWHLHGTV